MSPKARKQMPKQPPAIGRWAREADQAWRRGEAVIIMPLMDYWTLDTQATNWQKAMAAAKHHGRTRQA